jgi:hypothetical protein
LLPWTVAVAADLLSVMEVPRGALPAALLNDQRLVSSALVVPVVAMNRTQYFDNAAETLEVGKGIAMSCGGCQQAGSDETRHVQATQRLNVDGPPDL